MVADRNDGSWDPVTLVDCKDPAGVAPDAQATLADTGGILVVMAYEPRSMV